MNKATQNLINAGLIFMHSVWIQGQMSDLTICKKNPELATEFVKSPNVVPQEYFKVRASYWEKQFGEVKNEFVSAFRDELSESEHGDIERLLTVRNMIAHAHLSGGREFMLYRPANERKEREVLKALGISKSEMSSDPLMITLEFWRPELFKRESDLVERLDQVCFSRLAKGLGVPHERIR
ncbi:TPA: hypothetical protein ACXNIM_002410 [Stenotrophomonas maltophilia]